jgi:tetratricopeptide (TPR) repeat protein
MELELDNYRAVLEWALKEEHDPALGGAVAGGLHGLWFHNGLAVEGRYWIGLAQARLDESAYPQVSARLWRALQWLSNGKRKGECAQRALALSESVGDERGQALALLGLALSLYEMGQLEDASDASARALETMRTLEHKRGAATCLNLQAIIRQRLGDVVAARELYAQVLAICKAAGDEAGEALVLANLAEAEFGDGQVERALRLARAGLEVDERGKDAAALAADHNNIATYRIALGDVDSAHEAAREGLRWGRQAQDALSIASALQHLALLLALRGELNDASRVMGYINAQYRELTYERQTTEKWGYERLMAILSEHLSDTAIAKLEAEGAAWSEDQAVVEALKA